MKIIQCFVLSLYALSAAAVSPSSGSDEAADPETPAVARIQGNLLPVHYLEGHVTSKSIPQVMLEDDVPGVSMAFVDKGEITWVRSYGYARLAKLEKVTPSTVFVGASLSKPITAMAALSLVDDGLIALDADVNRYLKGWTIPESELTREQKVSLRQLIGHTAGVDNHLLTSYAPGEAIPTVEQILAGQPPSVDPAATVTAAPGERQRYSNPGYTIIQKLLQDLTGQPFDAVIEQRVIEPAGMKESTFAQPIPDDLMERRATGYTKELQPYAYELFPFKAAGGVSTTPSDLARFMVAVMDDYHAGSGKLISKALADEVFARTPERLGFAKHIADTGDGLVFEHWGSNAGFSCYLVGSLEHRQGLVIMTNSDNGFSLMASIARAVADQHDWPALQSTVYRAVAVPARAMQGFAGTYDDGKGGNAVSFMVSEGDGLQLSTQETTHALVPVAANKFILPEQYTTYEFLKGKDGAVKWVRVTLGSSYNYDLVRR